MNDAAEIDWTTDSDLLSVGDTSSALFGPNQPLRTDETVNPRAQSDGTIASVRCGSGGPRRDSTEDTVTVAAATPVVVLDRANLPRDRVKLLREWEGVVESIADGQVFARLAHTDAPLEAELVEFSVDEVAPDDIPLLRRGAVFYWVIGRRTTVFGSVSNFSEIRFRRLPAWSATEIANARRRGNELIAELFGETT